MTRNKYMLAQAALPLVMALMVLLPASALASGVLSPAEAEVVVGGACYPQCTGAGTCKAQPTPGPEGRACNSTCSASGTRSYCFGGWGGQKCEETTEEGGCGYLMLGGIVRPFGGGLACVPVDETAFTDIPCNRTICTH